MCIAEETVERERDYVDSVHRLGQPIILTYKYTISM